MANFKYLSTALLSLTLMGLSGCNTINPQTTTDKAATQYDDSSSTQCRPFDENAALMMCTMHFDPVCVKEKDADGKISYRTAGNDCTACNSPQAISYTPGECQ